MPYRLHMLPAIRERWTAALRSGKYTQGQASLRHRNTDGTEQHCCLGVLCDLAVADGVIPAPAVNSSGDYEYEATTREGAFLWPEAGILPRTVYEWAGLTDGNPVVSVEPGTLADGYVTSGTLTLAELNDHWVPFNEIADIIDNG